MVIRYIFISDNHSVFFLCLRLYLRLVKNRFADEMFEDLSEYFYL